MAEYSEDIKGFPKEVVDRMLREAEIQGRSITIEVLERSRSGGFNFEDTKDGFSFWRKVVDGDFDLFFEKYPKSVIPKSNWVLEKYIQVNDVRIGLPLKRGTYEQNQLGLDTINEYLKDASAETRFRRPTLQEAEIYFEKLKEQHPEKYEYTDSVFLSEGTIYMGLTDIVVNNLSDLYESYPVWVEEELDVVKQAAEIIPDTYASVDGFIDYNQEELQVMSDKNPVLFDALNGVLAELRVAYEGAEPIKKPKKKKKKTPKKAKPEPKVVVEEEEEIDLDSLMDDMDDSCDLVIDDILCEIDDFELD